MDDEFDKINQQEMEEAPVFTEINRQFFMPDNGVVSRWSFEVTKFWGMIKTSQRVTEGCAGIVEVSERVFDPRVFFERYDAVRIGDFRPRRKATSSPKWVFSLFGEFQLLYNA